jgi:4-alpha-glucanotransferase
MNALLDKRRAGVLLHITSLPGPGNCGDMGQEAINFVNFLYDVGISVWQTLPLGMPHGDGSPYQCLSAHAGSPELISLDRLVQQGWLRYFPAADCDKRSVLAEAYGNFVQIADAKALKAFNDFCSDKAYWLDDFALFMALRDKYQQQCWYQWPEGVKQRKPQAIATAKRNLKIKIEAVKFEQYVFFQQWLELKAYADQKGVLLFGDIPIFVSYDSSDVWANREVFKLNADGEMEVVAGVPPDYFSEFGQRWGNPHYNWEYLKKTGFKWWLDRIRSQYELFDILRIDHFRGLEAAWEIPAEEETAVNGCWVEAPGYELLQTIGNQFPLLSLVAEDLGIITESVEALRGAYKLPGMKILQFAFDGNSANPYLPMNFSPNNVAYTGTHDNDTTLGWFEHLSDQERQRVYDYLAESGLSMPWALIHATLASVAKLAVVPMQDILCLGGEHRMNTPGTTVGNWHWRFDWSQLSDDKAGRFAYFVRLLGRS